MLIRRIEIFLRDTGLPPTRLGRLALGDPRLLSDLRNGRVLREKTVQRLEHFMNIYQERQDAR